MMLFHLEQTDMNDLIWSLFRTGVDYSVRVKEPPRFIADTPARMGMKCKFRKILKARAVQKLIITFVLCDIRFICFVLLISFCLKKK